MTTPQSIPAVFFDRDGTLNVEAGYIREVENLNLYPGAAAAVRQLNDAGVLAMLTTNQSGPARGFYDESHVRDLHKRLEELLWQEAGAKLDAIFYCPHLPHGTVEPYAGECECRKPKTGMIQAACEQFPQIDLSRSVVFGDKATDVELAVNAGCQSILLKTGYGQRVLDGKYQVLNRQPIWVCQDVVEGVNTYLEWLKIATLE